MSDNRIYNTSVCVAISGGSDSVALLRSLYLLKDQYSISLSAAHVNYHLRGDDSNDDETFVRELTTTLNIPIYVHDSSLENHSSGIEESARNIRYAFFQDLRKNETIDYIALGHTEDDQAETVLFRLARGTSIHGASAMMPMRSDGIIRPMLDVSRDLLRKWLCDNEITWREDRSNTDSKFKRNEIRNEILPLLKSINPQIVKHFAQFAQNCRDSSSFMLEQGMNVLEEHSLWCSDNLFHFHTPAVWDESMKVAVSRLLSTRNCSIDAKHIDQITLAGSHRGKVTLLPQGWSIYSSYNRLLFYNENGFPFTSTASGKRTAKIVNHSYLGLYKLPTEGSENEISFLDCVDENVSILLKLKLKKRGFPSLERHCFPVYHEGETIVLLTII